MLIFIDKRCSRSHPNKVYGLSFERKSLTPSVFFTLFLSSSCNRLQIPHAYIYNGKRLPAKNSKTAVAYHSHAVKRNADCHKTTRNTQQRKLMRIENVCVCVCMYAMWLFKSYSKSHVKNLRKHYLI